MGGIGRDFSLSTPLRLILRATYNAKAFLGGYSGYLQTDGHDSAVKDMPGIIHVGCMAHARKKFFEASRINKKPQSAEEGIKHIRRLYRLEDALRGKWKDDLERFNEERKKEAAPLLDEFKTWLLKCVDEVPPKTLLGEAVNYTLNQWDKLTRYLENPCLTLYNNACENAIRPFVLGRKTGYSARAWAGSKVHAAYTRL